MTFYISIKDLNTLDTTLYNLNVCHEKRLRYLGSTTGHYNVLNLLGKYLLFRVISLPLLLFWALNIEIILLFFALSDVS